MRYLFAVIANTNGRVEADPAEMSAIEAFNLKIEAAGQRVLAAGVAHVDAARTFDNRGGRGLVTNGPAVNTEVFMSGFWVIEAENDSVAHDLARAASQACNRRIEVRPLL